MRPEAQPQFFSKEGARTKSRFCSQKMSNLGPGLKKLMHIKRITDRAWGAEPPAARQIL